MLRPNVFWPAVWVRPLKGASALWQTPNLPILAVSTGVEQQPVSPNRLTLIVLSESLGGWTGVVHSGVASVLAILKLKKGVLIELEFLKHVSVLVSWMTVAVPVQPWPAYVTMCVPLPNMAEPTACVKDLKPSGRLLAS